MSAETLQFKTELARLRIGGLEQQQVRQLLPIRYGRLLYDQAVFTEGSKVKDPVGFAQRINELTAKEAGRWNLFSVPVTGHCDRSGRQRRVLQEAS